MWRTSILFLSIFAFSQASLNPEVGIQAIDNGPLQESRQQVAKQSEDDNTLIAMAPLEKEKVGWQIK